jgi:hypothetical protein
MIQTEEAGRNHNAVDLHRTAPIGAVRHFKFAMASLRDHPILMLKPASPIPNVFAGDQFMVWPEPVEFRPEVFLLPFH